MNHLSQTKEAQLSPRCRRQSYTSYHTVLSTLTTTTHQTTTDIEKQQQQVPAAVPFQHLHQKAETTTVLFSSHSASTISDVSAEEEDMMIDDGIETVSSSLKPSNMDSLHKNNHNNNNNPAKVYQLIFGASGIYIAYLYYGLVQEDLFRYKSPLTGEAFTHVWALQAVESAVTFGFGALGRRQRSNNNNNNNHKKAAAVGRHNNNNNMPPGLFLQAGGAQLLAKILMSLSLAAGLAFPVVVLAKSAKVLPVMLGQFIIGGSKYKVRDYLFAILICSGTFLVSAGSSSRQYDTTDPSTIGSNNSNDNKSSWTGMTLIFLSLCADGLTGGLQKKLKRDTAMFQPNAFDFLYYSHMAQFTIASIICGMTGEFHSALLLLQRDWRLVWYVAASCLCSAVGQCFIFYVIAIFDPLVCTTITTTRKMMSVMISICFKGHSLSGSGCLGLGLAASALFMEMEGGLAAYRIHSKKRTSGGADASS